MILAAAGLAALFWLFGSLFGLFDFGGRTIDRSQPPLLVKLTDLSQYHAASANFEVIVDLEKDTKYVPSFIAGQRSLMVAAGSVDAQVDFSQLKDDKVQVSEDRRSVHIVLPAPTFTDVTLDNDRTYVASRSRGLLDRVGGVFTGNPTNDQPLYQAADAKLTDAAKNTDLLKLGETNTRNMLESMLRSLGFENIAVDFEQPPGTP